MDGPRRLLSRQGYFSDSRRDRGDLNLRTFSVVSLELVAVLQGATAGGIFTDQVDGVVEAVEESTGLTSGLLNVDLAGLVGVLVGGLLGQQLLGLFLLGLLLEETVGVGVVEVTRRG